MVISCDPCVELDPSRECDGFDDTVEIECSDGLYSPSECVGVSTKVSSGIDSGTDFCEGALVDMTKGRMIDQGGDWFIRSVSFGSWS